MSYLKLKLTITLSCVGLLSACATSSVNRPAKNWVFVTGSENSSGVIRYYADPTTVKVNPTGNRTAEIAEIYSYQKLYDNGQYLRGVVRLKEFDCANSKHRTLSIKVYSDAMLTELIGTSPAPEQNWSEGSRRSYTIGANQTSFVCDL